MLIGILVLCSFLECVFSRSGVYRDANFYDGVDLTVMPGSSGEQVVTACIQKIESLQVFQNDFGLMKRIAKVETDFGTNYTGADQSRGIWQVSSSIQTRLTSVEALLHLGTQQNSLREAFGEDVLNFFDADYSVPLKSAIATRLYIELIQGTIPVPGTLLEQAVWWEKHYNHDEFAAVHFEETIRSFEASKTCSAEKLDLWFCLDGSSSIGYKNFRTALDFVLQLASEFNVSSEQVRTGLSIYSTSLNTVSYLNDHTSNFAFATAVRATYYPGGGTLTGAAISDVTVNGFDVTNGARSTSEGVPRVLIVLTDGQSHDHVTEPASNAHEAGITVFAVGIGSGIDPEEIKEIASEPDSKHAYTLEDFDALLTILKQAMTEAACTASAHIPNETTIYVNLSPGNVYYSSIKIPTSGYVTVSFVVAKNFGSAGRVYIGTYPNPNEALNLACYDLNPGESVSFTVSASGAVRRNGLLVLQVSDRSVQSIPLYASIVSTGTTVLNFNLQSEILSTITVPPTTTQVSDVTTTSSTTAAAQPTTYPQTTTTDVIQTSTNDVIDTTYALLAPDVTSLRTIIIVVGCIIALIALLTIAFLVYTVVKSKMK